MTSAVISDSPASGVSPSRHYKNLLRIRIFHFAARSVTAHVDIAAIRIEWIKNQPGFARNWFCHWKLRGVGGLLRGWRLLRRRFVCRNSRRCSRRWPVQFARSCARCGCWRRHGYRLARISHIGRVRRRRRFRFVKNMTHRCGDGAANLMRGFATNRAGCNQRDHPAAAIHRGLIRCLFVSATHRQRIDRFPSRSSPKST